MIVKCISNRIFASMTILCYLGIHASQETEKLKDLCSKAFDTHVNTQEIESYKTQLLELFFKEGRRLNQHRYLLEDIQKARFVSEDEKTLIENKLQKILPSLPENKKRVLNHLLNKYVLIPENEFYACLSALQGNVKTHLNLKEYLFGYSPLWLGEFPELEKYSKDKYIIISYRQAFCLVEYLDPYLIQIVFHSFPPLYMCANGVFRSDFSTIKDCIESKDANSCSEPIISSPQFK